MIDVFGLRKCYGDRTVLEIDDWQVSGGEHWLVLGQSGSGKSTLIHLLAGLTRPSDGRIRVLEQDYGQSSSAELDRFRGRNVGIVFQNFHLLDSLTALQNVLLAQYLAGLKQEPTRCRAVLEGLELGPRLTARPRDLSQGERQRVALARAVVNRPKLLLADEPTSSLDDESCERVIGLLDTQARAHRATLIVATHDRRLTGRFDRRLEIGS